MADSQNWQRYGSFDLGIHDFMDDEFEFDFREEEFWRGFPTVVPLGHTYSTQPGTGKPWWIHNKRSFTSVAITYKIYIYIAGGSGSTDQGHNAIPVQQLDDEAVEAFVDQQKYKNTKRKTHSDLKTWYTWCGKHGETRELKDIPPAELDRLLGHFFVTVRRKDGSLYEPDTLSSFQRSIDRHLTKDLHKTYSIIRNTQFAPSREKLKASRSSLRARAKATNPMLRWYGRGGAAVAARCFWSKWSCDPPADGMVDHKHPDGNKGTWRAPQV